MTLVLDSDDEPLQRSKPSKKILSEDEGALKISDTCLRLILRARQLPKSIHVSDASLIYSILTSEFRRLKRKAPVLVSSDEEECSPPKKKTAAARARPSSTPATKEKVKAKKRKDVEDFEMESPPVSDHEKPNKRELGAKHSLSNVKTEKVPVAPSKGITNNPPKKNECVLSFYLLER